MIYIPPESSNFYNDDEIMQLEFLITSFCRSHAYVMLTGDFNSCTSSHPDDIETDDFISDLFDFDSETTEMFNHNNKRFKYFER